MKVTLLACYEQGHQPLSLASPLAVLSDAGYQVEAYDLSVQGFPVRSLLESKMVAISTPMHTALKLAVAAAKRVRLLNPEAHICFYGLYAWLNAELLLNRRTREGQAIVDSAVGGEYEAPLRSLAAALEYGAALASLAGVKTAGNGDSPAYLRRMQFPLPDRSSLPPASEYAHLALDGSLVTAGYTEGTRGCLHTCSHCPVVPVYNGRFFVVPADTVLADIRQQVRNGVRHITFGDPDFLNGPGHALKIVRAMHQEFPTITFDFTTKVEHIVQHSSTIGELASLGAAFVVSAFESTSDRVLERLRKGHTLTDMNQALKILDRVGLPVQATWVPFTPWTSLEEYLAMLAWIRTRRLVPQVAAVQLSIRLLVPPGSALLDHPDRQEWIGALDEGGFSYRWQHGDPRMDRLQRSIAQCVERSSSLSAETQFGQIERLAYEAAGRSRPLPNIEPHEPAVAPPRLTEDWFC